MKDDDGIRFLGDASLWGVLLAPLVGGAASALRQITGIRSSGGQRRPAARQALDERFARGEISQEEYDEIRARLED